MKQILVQKIFLLIAVTFASAFSVEQLGVRLMSEKTRLDSSTILFLLRVLFFVLIDRNCWPNCEIRRDRKSICHAKVPARMSWICAM